MDCGPSPGIMASAPSRAGAGFGSGVPASRHGQRPNDRIQAGDEFATIQIAEPLRDGDYGAGITAAVLRQQHPVVRSSDSRLASTEPAAPALTMTQSKSTITF